MKRKVQVQLSGMMFIEFFIWGAWFVTMWRYLAAANFGHITGWAYSTTGIAALISPLFVGMIIGNLMNGRVTRHYEIAGETVTHNWMMIWLIPCVMAAVTLVIFAMFFKENQNREQ